MTGARAVTVVQVTASARTVAARSRTATGGDPAGSRSAHEARPGRGDPDGGAVVTFSVPIRPTMYRSRGPPGPGGRRHTRHRRHPPR